MHNYPLSRHLARHRVIEIILVAIDDQEICQNRQILLLKWLELLSLTTENWPDLWIGLYACTTEILWALLADQSTSIDFCIQIQHLLRVWKEKCNISSSPSM